MLRFRCSVAFWAAVAATVLSASAADVCNPTDLYGTYGFQVAGTTRIAGPEKAIAVTGRLAFGDGGNVSGVSSVNFDGLFLGNPVTGTYQAKTDCTATWSLQDTSGAFQHFSGKMQPFGGRVDFHQTDPGTGAPGVLARVPESCDNTTFQGSYDFQSDGVPTPFANAPAPNLTVKAAAEADGNGGLTLSRGGSTTSGSYSVDSDCFVQLTIGLPDADAALVKFRGILVDGGREVLAVSTDPEHVAGARFAGRK